VTDLQDLVNFARMWRFSATALAASAPGEDTMLDMTHPRAGGLRFAVLVFDPPLLACVAPRRESLRLAAPHGADLGFGLEASTLGVSACRSAAESSIEAV
jgi:hypothetical protein